MPDQPPIASPLLCRAENSCLVVIDVQARLIAAMPAKVLARLKRNSIMLIQAADILSVPVFATEQYPQGLGSLDPDITGVLPKNSRRFEKTCFSCADADNFINELNKCERKQIILLGLEAHICVLQTALDLLTTGYNVFVVTDAICSRQRENYESALQRMCQSGIITCNAESVLFEWLRDSNHEHFKKLSAMVR